MRGIQPPATGTSKLDVFAVILYISFMYGTLACLVPGLVGENHDMMVELSFTTSRVVSGDTRIDRVRSTAPKFNIKRAMYHPYKMYTTLHLKKAQGGSMGLVNKGRLSSSFYTHYHLHTRAVLTNSICIPAQHAWPRHMHLEKLTIKNRLTSELKSVELIYRYVYVTCAVSIRSVVEGVCLISCSMAHTPDRS